MRPFVIHAHFYQPERLNPWTGALDPEPSAAPQRDWNERVLRECYRPNGAARIYDGQGRVERIVNNYERLSFNFGPTLLWWMEHAHPDTYAKVLDGDQRARARTGHGNALAQAFNHMILPLANDRDQRTQIRWGLADFRYRFGREAVGLWLPETAADRATFDALIDEGVGFTVLAPHQIARVRAPGMPWRKATDALDTGRVYRHRHSDGSGRSIAVFVYDGGLAQALAFDPATGDTHALLERLEQTGAGRVGLVHAALDGETFGHHHHFRELGLAQALFGAAEARGLQPMSYEAYLAAHSPTDELEVIGGEGTAWSCAHGVGRWYRDCGCVTDSAPGWNQAWRTPLRQALDVVRDAAAAAFSERGGQLLHDPWTARDHFIAVRLETISRSDFLDRHARQHLSDTQQVDVWTLLEAQRHAMVMYTSCGWFFGDVSGLETRYVLRCAHRVLGLLEEVGFPAPWDEVLAILGEARSNRPEAGTAADVWREHIEPAAVGPARVAAHLALVGLVRSLDPEFTTAGHAVTVHRHRREQRGRVALSTAQLEVTSLATRRRSDLAVAALHLGGLDVHASVSQHSSDEAFRSADRRLWQAFPTAPTVRLVKLVAEVFPHGAFGFEQLLPDGAQELVGVIFSDLGYALDREPVADAVTAALVEATRKACASLDHADAAAVERWLALAGDLGVDVDLSWAQELVYDLATRARAGQLGPEGRALAARLGRPLGLAPTAWSAGGG